MTSPSCTKPLPDPFDEREPVNNCTCPDCQPKPSEGTVSEHDLRELHNELGALPFIGIESMSHRSRLAVEELLTARATIERQAGEIARYKRLWDTEHELHKQNGYGYQDDIRRLEADLADARLDRDGFVEKAATNMRLYMDLLMQVVHVVPGETRHESAKRIINQHENQSHGPACAAIAAGDGK